MKKDKVKLVFCFLIAMTDFFFGFYGSVLSWGIFIALTGISERKRRRFRLKLSRLKLVNPLFREKREKLIRAFGASDLNEEEYCSLLKEQAGSKAEKRFFEELKCCRNTTGIARLIRDYESECEEKGGNLVFDRLLFAWTIVLYSLVFPHFRLSFSPYLLSVLFNAALILLEMLPRRISTTEAFFLSFQRKLAYMSPKDSFESTRKAYPKAARGLERFSECVREKKFDARWFSSPSGEMMIAMYGALSSGKGNFRDLEDAAFRIRLKRRENHRLLEQGILALAYLGLIGGGILA